VKNKLRLFTNVTSIVLLIFVVFAYFQRQQIYDWYRLRGYTPPAEISALAEATTMNSDGRRLFYINQPDIQEKEEFSQNCTVAEESIILGCYVSNSGIYIYDVKDERLSGIEEVTAAHEMLHAAYERLSDVDRANIDSLTAKELSKIKDERLLKTVDSYRKRDPSVIPNELHSILATEVRDLSPELEEYYSRYFERRLAIIELSEKYESNFTELESRADNFKQQLDNLKQEIEKQNQDLATEAAALSSEYDELQLSRNSSSADFFNEKARVYNLRVNEYNYQVSVVSQKIDSYNSILSEYNSIITQENELYNAIDSRPKTINGQ
jgi:uncharacterized coiled-coil DUF342 family protein